MASFNKDTEEAQSRLRRRRGGCQCAGWLVLGEIVSLLGTEEGARTAVLSRRWRDIWRSAPLNLDDRRLRFYSYDQHLLVISQIIAAHPGPARRLALNRFLIYCDASRYDDWFSLPIFDALQELVLHFRAPIGDGSRIPASALRFSSLRVLELKNCTFFRWPGGCAPAFPCLTSLALSGVGITEEILHGIISNSPGIEHMAFNSNFGYRRLCLSLPRLRFLGVLNCMRRLEDIELEDIVVENAGSLERLLLHEGKEYGPSVRIIGPTTKLKMLGYLGAGFPIIQLGQSIFKAMIPVNLVSQFSTVKILALEMPYLGPNLQIVIGYLACFPCLEKLHLEFYRHFWNSSMKCALRWDPCARIDCLDRSLKTITLQSYAGVKTHVELAKFFIKRARVLEVIKLCSMGKNTKRWFENQHRQLDFKNRASRWAHILFAHHCHLDNVFWMDERFSTDDPFKECR